MNEHARLAFARVLGDADETALLVDSSGLVKAGVYLDGEGNDVTAEIGSAFAGLGPEAARAMRHLGIGGWRAIICEHAEANLALAPGGEDDDVVVVVTAPNIPAGFVRRLLHRASVRARAWAEEVA
ncbi:MAG TPA: hypothetical protein VM939_00320 [Gemmatimonadaceae bacterium]|nr:hypothetical protein [Gemmatimonadaceae bacterium]